MHMTHRTLLSTPVMAQYYSMPYCRVLSLAYEDAESECKMHKHKVFAGVPTPDRNEQSGNIASLWAAQSLVIKYDTINYICQRKLNWAQCVVWVWLCVFFFFSSSLSWWAVMRFWPRVKLAMIIHYSLGLNIAHKSAHLIMLNYSVSDRRRVQKQLSCQILKLSYRVLWIHQHCPNYFGFLIMYLNSQVSSKEDSGEFKQETQKESSKNKRKLSYSSLLN